MLKHNLRRLEGRPASGETRNPKPEIRNKLKGETLAGKSGNCENLKGRKQEESLENGVRDTGRSCALVSRFRCFVFSRSRSRRFGAACAESPCHGLAFCGRIADPRVRGKTTFKSSHGGFGKTTFKSSHDKAALSAPPASALRRWAPPRPAPLRPAPRRAEEPRRAAGPRSAPPRAERRALPP